MNPALLLLMGLGVVLILLVYVVMRLDGGSKPEWKSTVKKKLADIDGRFNAADAHGLRSILVEMDSLVDFCLKSRGVQGNTMGERLKAARSLFDKHDYNALWEAHKVRNRLVHEVEFRAVASEMKKEIGFLRGAVKKLVG